MFLDQVIGFFSSDMGIDLGTANTLVLVKDKGIIINEPSVVAVRREKYGKQKILAVGHAAKEMVGKTPGDIEAIRPMRDGVIADFDMTERMIRYFIEKTHKRKSFLRPRIIISVPYGLTQVERKAVRESALSAGAREVFLIEEPMAAAIGANLPVREPQGNLVVDIGGGTTEIGVVSLGGLVISKSIRTAGDKIDSSIVNYIKEKYKIYILESLEEYRIKDMYDMLNNRDVLASANGFIVFSYENHVHFIRNNEDSFLTSFYIKFPINHPVEGRRMSNVIFRVIHLICNFYEKRYLKADKSAAFSKVVERYGCEIKVNCLVGEVIGVLTVLQKIVKGLYYYEKENL